MTKPELRAAVRKKLALLSAEDLAARSAAIRSRITRHPAWRGAATVCLFAAQPSEPNIDLLCAEEPRKRICFPRVHGSLLEIIPVTGPEDLVPSKWNLREPSGNSGALPLAEIDLILVPGLAFTRAGARLGRGGGFYDQLLADPLLKATRIGICFEIQIVDEIPTMPHDQPVHEVLTETPP